MNKSINADEQLAMEALSMISSGEINNVLPALHAVAATEKIHPGVWALVGLYMRVSGNLPHALEAQKASLKIEPSPEALYEISMVSMLLGQKNESKTYVKRLIHEYPAWSHVAARLNP